MWKTGPEPGTKPVIARDTTCSVSLLTGTICGSNFAIPSTKIPPHGNGTELPSSTEELKMRSGARPEVTRYLRNNQNTRLRRLGFQIRKSGARNLKRNKPSGFPKAENQKSAEVRWPFPDPPPGRDNNCSEVDHQFVTCPPADQGNSFFLRAAAGPRSP
jgi:hypothetical protein